MLIKCPECELQASDKVASCPHCGYPLKPNAKITSYRRPSKRRRLPNGFGQISEIKGHNLLNPFRAMVTVGKTTDGRPICKSLKPESYFATYNDAYAALVEYNKNPYNLEPAIKAKELYENMKNKIKTLFNQMLDYAVEYEIVDRNYSRSFNLSEEVIKEVRSVEKSHIAFTDEELETLWAHVDDKRYVDAILIQCYSGWRPQELGLLELENIDLKNWVFQGGYQDGRRERSYRPDSLKDTPPYLAQI